MKKLLVLLVVGLLAVTSLTGCAAPKTYKFGTGSYTTIKASAAVAAVEAVPATKTTAEVPAVEAADGRVQVTSVYAAVLLDDAGKIVYVDIDSAQNQGTFDATGAVVKAEAAPTKTEKGADYGMTEASAIGKEWFEQMAALEAYFVGKTIEEIKAIPVNETFNPTGDDLKASVSIKIDPYLAAVEKAVANAVEVKGVAKVGVGSVASVSGRAAVAAVEATATTAAVEAAPGRIQTNVTFTGVAFDKDGKVLVALLDVAQNNGTFDTTGAIVKAEAAPTKQEKGADYGMIKASTIGKEWFEQANALTAYFVGKTADEVAAIEFDAEGVAVAEDLKTSVSVGIDEYLASFAKAVANAVEVK
jgi:hypothetical protein